MYERFTSEARQVLVTASADSRLFGQPETGTEHLLLALTKVDAWVSDLLVGYGVTREAVSAVLPRKSSPPGPSSPVPLTKECKIALEAAAQFADEEGDRRVRPYHLLLGILQVGGGATGVLIALEVPVERLRKAINEVAGPIGVGETPDAPLTFESLEPDGPTGVTTPGATAVPSGAQADAIDVPALCPGCHRPLPAELPGSSRRVTGRRDLELVVVSCPSCGHVLATAIDFRGP